MDVSTLIEKTHEALDNIITNNPGQFPDGPDFRAALYAYLNHLTEENVIEQWSLHPMSADGFKINLHLDNNEKVTILRNDDGGKA